MQIKQKGWCQRLEIHALHFTCPILKESLYTNVFDKLTFNSQINHQNEKTRNKAKFP